MASGSDKSLVKALDRHLREKIEQKLRANPNYFTDRVTAADIMPYLQPIIGTRTMREGVECLDKTEGNTRASRKMIDQMQKYSGFALVFLRALVGTNLRDIAEDLTVGFNLDPHECQADALFIRDLLQTPPLAPTPPPPYSSSISLQDQQRKFEQYNSIPSNPSLFSADDNSEMSSIHDSELSLSTTASTQLSTQTQSNPPPYQNVRRDDTSSLMNRTATNFSDNIHSTLPQNEQFSFGQQDGPRNVFPLPNQFDNLTSDLHQSEFCVSADPTNETIPKETTSPLTSSDYFPSDERLNAIVLNASNRQQRSVPDNASSTLNESIDSQATCFEQEQWIIADSPRDLKGSNAASADADSSDYMTVDGIGQSNDVLKDYLWNYGLIIVAVLSVAASFVMRNK